MKNLMTNSGWTVLIFSAALAAGCSNATSRGSEVIDCTPGATVSVGCGALGLGACTGDPILTVCDGSTTTPETCGEDSAAVLQSNDDFAFPDLCPGLTVTCPASGELSVRPTAFGTRSFTCDWESSEG